MSRRLGMLVPKAITCIVIVVASACGPSTKDPPPPLTECRSPRTGIVKSGFHSVPSAGGSTTTSRTGWNDREPTLTPDRVGRGMVSQWTSPPFESLVVRNTTYVGRTYASPLYADGVRIARGPGTGAQLSVIFTATSNGDVYAVAASDAPCAEGTLTAGTILWRNRIVTAEPPPHLDARDVGPGLLFPGIAVGTLATPVLDLAASTLYVTAMDASVPGKLPVWMAFAIDITTGDIKPGWPVTLDRNTIEAANKNGPAYFDDDARFVSQRAALVLSPEGDRVYIAFGSYWSEGAGWLVAVDTRATTPPRVTASFSSASDLMLGPNGERRRHSNGGMWAPGGPSVDDAGQIYMTTGNGPEQDGIERKPTTWSSSMLRFDRDLKLVGVYTPYDHCDLDRRNIDLSGSSPTLLPDLDAAAPTSASTSTSTSTPHLVAFGGKSGVVYLLDRDNIAPPSPTGRPACSSAWDDAERDTSLLPPEPQNDVHCDGRMSAVDPCAEPKASTRCVRGPLQVFGPAGDESQVDFAKMRTKPAFFRDDGGRSFLFVAGSTKTKRCTADNKPPSIARLRIATAAEPGKPAWLAIDGVDPELQLINPGSPVISSDGARSPIVWVVDQNARRTQPLLDPTTPGPILYAVDGVTMKRLWSSAATDLEPGGKYVTPIVAHGMVYVATDRLHAFAPAP